jgi:hypothetical protein
MEALLAMPTEAKGLAQTVTSMRPMVPAKDFAASQRFYVELGFQSRRLTDSLVEMSLGTYSFILQSYYVREWADNFVIHIAVSDLSLWWNHIVSLDLAGRHGVKTWPPQSEGWAVVASITDPSGVLLRFAESPAPNCG